MPNTAPSQQSLAQFETYRQAINKALADYLPGLPERVGGQDLPLVATQALELIQEFTLRPGKRVRGALAAIVYDDLTGQHLSENGLKLAIAMELLQSYLLIVDDVTDKSDTRRGEPTVHRLYEQLYDSKLSERDAEQLAFYTGMIAGHIANLVLVSADEKPEHITHAVECVHLNIVTTGFGQLDDIMQEIGREATEADIIRKYSLKTSHYTFINPLEAGMALAGVTDSVAYQQVTAFGLAAGIAFQAHDDYLGVFGGSETGKPNTDDIREGKLTLLVQHALQHASPVDAAKLQTFLGSHKVGEREMQAVREIFDRSGATMEIRTVSQRYADEALRAIDTVSVWSESFKAILSELVHYIVSRKS